MNIKIKAFAIVMTLMLLLDNTIGLTDYVHTGWVGWINNATGGPVISKAEGEDTQSTWTLTEDITDTSLKDAIDNLSNLGILKGYEDGTFRPDNTITRAEFCAVVTRMLGLQDAVQANSGKTSFNDVAADHWAAGNINVAYNMGIIKGYGDGIFGPSDPVTYEQAVKMLVCALGNEQAALEKGEYPMGYLAVAAQLGLLKGIEGNIGEPAKRGLIAKMTNNSLNAKVTQQVTYGGKTSYSSGGNVISEKFNIEKRVGIVNASYDLSLSGTTGLRKTEVEIDGKIYDAGDTTIASMVGYVVSFYVKINTNEDENTIVSFQQGKNNEIAVNAANIDEETSAQKFVYWVDRNTDAKAKTAYLSENAKIVLNGQLGRIQDDTLKPQVGQVKLIDNNGDGKYDVAFVSHYETYVVDSVNTYNSTVYPKYGKDAIQLDPKSNDYTLSLEKDGQKITNLAMIQQWDVLAVAESQNSSGKKIKKVLIISQVVSGVISELGDGEFFVGGKSYKLLPNSYNEELPDIDDRVDLYLTFDGRIAGIRRYFNTYDAYLMNASLSTGVNNKADVQLYLLNGGVTTVKTASKITVDDNGVLGTLEPEQFIQYLGGTNIHQQLVKYELNGLGELKKIILARNNVLGAYNQSWFSKDFVDTNAEYRSATKEFDGKYLMADTTKLIFVPMGESAKDGSKYKTSYSFVDGGRYSIEVYNVDPFDRIGVLILRETENMPKPVVPDQSLAVVIGIGKSILQGEEVYKISYYQNGMEGYKYLDDESLVSEIYEGSIIQFTEVENNKIGNVLILTPLENSDYQEINRSQYDGSTQISDVSTVYGAVYDYDFNIMALKVKLKDDIVKSYEMSPFIYGYEVDRGEKKVTLADMGKLDKNADQEIFMRVRSRKILDFVILK